MQTIRHTLKPVSSCDDDEIEFLPLILYVVQFSRYIDLETNLFLL